MPLRDGIDFIAASFVRKGKDVVHIREVLGEEGASIKIISKVRGAVQVESRSPNMSSIRDL